MSKLKQGCLLIAEPFMGDPNFERAVVFLCEHKLEGSFGLVLNQVSDFQLDDLISKNVYPEIKVNIGGPVDHTTLHFLHTRPDIIPNGFEVLNGLYWGGDFEVILKNLNLGVLGSNEIRFFLGYSGWAAGQLAIEISKNTWIISETKTSQVMKNSKEYWRESLRNMGGDYRVIANYPIDPRLN